MMDTAGDFLRVKRLWQTRSTRTHSSASQHQDTAPAPAPAPASAEKIAFPATSKTVPETPKTPAPGDGSPLSYESTEEIEESSQDVVASPTSSCTSTTTSASSSPMKPPVSAMSSMLKSFSEANIFNTSSSPPKSEASTEDPLLPTPLIPTLSLANLPVPSMPDMSSWREKMKLGRSKASSTASSTDLEPAAPSTASSTPSMLSLASLSCSLKSLSSTCSVDTSTGFSFGAVTSSATLSSREAAEHALGNVHNLCSRSRSVSSARLSGSPYGELIIVDVLAARELIRDNAPGGVELPVAVHLQLDALQRQSAPAERSRAVFNQRFVLWLPSTPSVDLRSLDLSVRGCDGCQLGEVHLSLSMPVNERFVDWFPLVRRTDGLKRGFLRAGVRRLVLTSSPLLAAAQTLAARESSLQLADYDIYGNTLPELWQDFPDADMDVNAAEDSTTGVKEDALTSKLNELSRRLMGLDLTLECSTAAGRRDIF